MISGSAVLLTLSQSISRELLMGYASTVQKKLIAMFNTRFHKGQGYEPLKSERTIEVV